MNGLSVMPAVELLSMLRRGQISPLELAEEYIQQIERLNPQLNALVDFDPERVRAQVRALKNPTGPLFGLPMTIKASIAVAGHRCETGSLLNKGHVPRENASSGGSSPASRRGDPGNHQLSRVSDGLRDRQSALRTDLESVGPGAGPPEVLAAANRRARLLPGSALPDWGATAGARYASPPTLPASAH